MDRSHIHVLAGALIGIALTSTLVVRTSQAMFSGTTSAHEDSWATGGAAIHNNAPATAVFDSSIDGKLTGGQSLTRCIVVTYDGSTTALGVKLYAVASGTLASELTVTIDQGSGTTGATGSCTGFTPSTAGIYSGTLANMAATNRDYATGVGTWAPVAGAAMTYQFTISVPNTPTAQNATAFATFTWEAQA
jgi:hypothetical protein